MTAEERIAELLARAGQPAMVFKNTQEADEEKLIQLWRGIVVLVINEYGSSLPRYIQHLTDTIDRLEVALFNVIGEREQLKRELHEAATAVRGSSLCCYCKHEDKPCMEKPCDTCILDRNRPGFEWRGIQEVQQHGERVG